MCADLDDCGTLPQTVGSDRKLDIETNCNILANRWIGKVDTLNRVSYLLLVSEYKTDKLARLTRYLDNSIRMAMYRLSNNLINFSRCTRITNGENVGDLRRSL